MATKLSLGRIVHYRLSQWDADSINKRRLDASKSGIAREEKGVVVHFGNSAVAGQVLPAICTAVWGDGTSGNFQVFLDGNDIYWATSRTEGENQGQWSWPSKD